MCWFITKNDKPRHNIAAYSFMKSNTIEAAPDVIAAKTFIWFDRVTFFLAWKTVTDWLNPNLENNEKVPAIAIIKLISPKSSGSKIVAIAR